jgi:hypothetical protein
MVHGLVKTDFDIYVSRIFGYVSRLKIHKAL